MKLCLLFLTILLINCFSDASGRGLSLNTTDAVTKAAKYLLKKRFEPDEGLKNSLPRTVVGLAFAVRSGIVPDSLLSSLRKELNMHIFVHMSQKNWSLFELSQYINALYATCQDPRSFQGMDLVEQLRSDIESTWDRSPAQVSPFPLLTLCIARDARRSDSYKLLRIYQRRENDRLSLKALIVQALACGSIQRARNLLQIKEFVRDVHSEFNATDVYSKSLSLQALHALYALNEKDKSEKISELLRNQLPDGSFGDTLSTYYTIPALLNKSLLDVKCEFSGTKDHAITHQMWDSLTVSAGEVTYSLWIDQGTQSVTHSMKIGLNRNETLYDVMKKAERENEVFRFLYDSTRLGKKVYSLAGIPNDAESRAAWNLYRGFQDHVRIHSKQNLSKQSAGVDQIWPKENDHFVFWFERDSN